MNREERWAAINEAFAKGDMKRAEEIAKQGAAAAANDSVTVTDAEAYLRAAQESGDAVAINHALDDLAAAHKAERDAKRGRPIMYKFGRPV